MKPLCMAVENFLRDVPVCRIATVLSNGSPHVSRVCPIFDVKTMFIDLTHAAGTANALKADRRVTVLIVSVRRKPCPGKRGCVYGGVTPN
jgi:hypothetical protein